MAAALSAEQVYQLAVNAGFKANGHSYSNAELLLAGLTPAEIAKFKQNTITQERNVDPNIPPSGGWLQNAVLMTQIAFQESGLIPDKHGVGPVDDSYGLWQINMLGPLGPANRSRFKLKKNEDLYDPSTNAHVAFEFWHDNEFAPPIVAFHPWTGSYQKAIKAIANGQSVKDPGTTSSDAVSPGIGSTDTTLPDMRGLIDLVRGLISTITDPSWWKRIGIGVLGALVILGAIVWLNRDTVAEVGAKAAMA